MTKLKTFWNRNNNNVVGVDVVRMSYIYTFTSETYSNIWSRGACVCLRGEEIWGREQNPKKKNRSGDSKTKHIRERDKRAMVVVVVTFAGCS